MEKTGLGIIVDDMKTNIAIARNGEYDFDTRTYWRDYVDDGALRTPQLRSRVNDDYWAEYDRWWFSDEVYGNNVYYLRECFDREILPEDVYNEYIRAAQDEDLWEGTDYSWRWTAYVVEKETSSLEVHGPLITSKWHQGDPYNISGKKPLGCVTVATAQLMKYYRHPSSYDWDSMPDEMQYRIESPELTSFLICLRSELKVNDNGGASIGDAKRVLQNYGYNVTQTDHNDTKIVSSLKRDYPVYARGEDSKGQGGHAWVIDGLRISSHRTDYVLYRLADMYYPDFQYEEAQSYEKYYTFSSLISYHMNWGWGPGYDGWILSYYKPTLIDGSTVYEFTKNH